MKPQNDNMTIASSDVEQVLGTSTVIDPDELEKARLDQRWREFCLNADRYVMEATRRRRPVDRTG